MFIIDRNDARRLRAGTDPAKWHTAFIWWPRFVLASTTGSEPSWKFVWFGEIVRRSIASEKIGRWNIHRWIYQTDTVLAH
ncbi:MAG: hypothetical protein KBD06_04300 [Candidatus Pacebacteria bacterium]|nr:hypothetical protein [Candidatus Paceibacterota bacterium]